MNITFFNTRKEYSKIKQELAENGLILKWKESSYDYAFISSIGFLDLVHLISQNADNSATLKIKTAVNNNEELEQLLRNHEKMLLLNLNHEIRDDEPDNHSNEYLNTFGIFDRILFANDELILKTSRDIKAFAVLKLEDIAGRIVQEDSQQILTKSTAIHYHAKNVEKVGYNTEIINTFAQGCVQMTKGIEEFNPSLIYAPLRGAKPIVDLMLEAYNILTKKALRIHYPVTSSFVSNGRKNNLVELERLQQNCLQYCSRMLYVDELNSGGMISGHFKEIKQVFGDSIAIQIFGLANNYARNIGVGVARKFEEIYPNALQIFPVAKLVTMDHRVMLTTHYTDYKQGPNTVPYLTSNQYPEIRNRFYSAVIQEIKRLLD